MKIRCPFCDNGTITERKPAVYAKGLFGRYKLEDAQNVKHPCAACIGGTIKFTSESVKLVFDKLMFFGSDSVAPEPIHQDKMIAWQGMVNQIILKLIEEKMP